MAAVPEAGTETPAHLKVSYVGKRMTTFPLFHNDIQYTFSFFASLLPKPQASFAKIFIRVGKTGPDFKGCKMGQFDWLHSEFCGLFNSGNSKRNSLVAKSVLGFR